MGEVAAFAQLLNQTGILTAIIDQIRFARARMGTYELIDFVVILIGYALSGEPTLQAFYEHLLPFADEFMALFGRKQLPSRSALSRFLAALDQASVERLRSLFQEDLLARTPFVDPGGITDRCEQSWLVVDVDGTRHPRLANAPCPKQSRCLPRIVALIASAPKAIRDANAAKWCAPAPLCFRPIPISRLRTFGGSGNGDYRGELLRAVQVLLGYGKQVGIPAQQIVIRLDGLYGNAAPLSSVLTSGLGVIARHKDYHLLDLAVVQAALAAVPAATCTHPESQTTRTLFDCPAVPLSPAGPTARLIVATHPATAVPPPVGEQRAETVYELFVSTLPSPAFSAKDVLDLYLHRGSFETVLADEDAEQDADRWVSRTAWGQECCRDPGPVDAGTSGCNSANTWLPQSCVPPNSLRLTLFRQPLPASQPLP
jgi:hypothetical protein